ncbi:MAG: hypothetical protein U1E65_31730 [Myxococcota bacterium]
MNTSALSQSRSQSRSRIRIGTATGTGTGTGLLLLTLLALPASAHDKRLLRSLALEPAGLTLHVLASVRVPSGPTKSAMLAMADANHDGQLGPSERKGLEDALIARALGGMILSVGTATRTLDGAESKLSIGDADSPIDLLIHGTVALPKSEASVRLTTKGSGESVDVEVLAGNRPVVQSSRGAPKKGTLKTVLGTTDAVVLRFSAYSATE